MPMNEREKWLNTMLENVDAVLVHCDLNGKRRIGSVLHYNRHTTVVRVMSGAKTSFLTTRHNTKHNIKFYLVIGDAERYWKK